jgi:hypothetical protein
MMETVVLVASATSPALQGATSITVQTQEGSRLYLQAGTMIQWLGDNSDYEVEQDITMGSNETGQIQIWPLLIKSKTSSTTIYIPEARSAIARDYPARTQAFRWREYLGPGNVPGFRDWFTA